MDAIAWTVQAMSFLSDKTISDALNIYRAVEIPLEPTLLLRYANAKTTSLAILITVEALSQAILYPATEALLEP